MTARGIAVTAACAWLAVACGDGEAGTVRARLYATQAPLLDAAHVASLAKSLGLSAAPRDTGDTIVVEDGERSLVIQKASGAFEYRDDAKLWDATAPAPALSHAEAEAFATSFLSDRGLLPPQARVGIVVERLAKADDGTLIPNHWLVGYYFQVDAAVNGAPTPVAVMGAAIEVRVGDGEVIGLRWHWRPLVPAGEVTLFDERKAFEVATASAEAPDLDPTGLDLLYILEPDNVPQPLIAPSYLVRTPYGDPSELQGVLVPATDRAPRAAIVSPRRSQSTTGPVSLAAEIQGGTPPYQARWIEQVSGETIATGNPATAVLPPGAHPVLLAVTDAAGLIARDERRVWVEQPQPTPLCTAPRPLPPEPTARIPGGAPEGTIALNGWRFSYEITAKHGLAVNDVQYQGNRMASDMRMPFYEIQTEQMPRQRCQLDSGAPDDAPCRADLLTPVPDIVAGADGTFRIEACWRVMNLPPGVESGGELLLCQGYTFGFQTKTCAPFDPNECVRFWPSVSYLYTQSEGGPCRNDLIVIEVSQRLDFDITGPDVAALIKDIAPVPGTSLDAPEVETEGLMALSGLPGLKDNYHQRDGGGRVLFPGCTGGLVTIDVNGVPMIVNLPGGYQCVHAHWRWPLLSELSPGDWGGGQVLIPTTQTAWVYVVRADPLELEPPLGSGARAFIDPPDPLNPLDENGDPIGADIVLWHVASSTADGDRLGLNHWFFR